MKIGQIYDGKLRYIVDLQKQLSDVRDKLPENTPEAIVTAIDSFVSNLFKYSQKNLEQGIKDMSLAIEKARELLVLCESKDKDKPKKNSPKILSFSVPSVEN